MADNLGVPGGAAGPAATDEISGAHYQRVKLTLGADNVNDGDVSSSNPLPISDNGGSLTVDNAALSVVGGGTEAAAMRVTIANNSTGLVSVDDNGGSLTVDNAALSTTGGGTEAAALRVTLANNSTGLVSVDDNGGSLTVDSGQLPASLGQKAMAASLPVVIASDQGALPIAISSGKISVVKLSGATIGASASTYTTGDVFGGLITLPNVLTTDTYFGRIKSLTVQVLESATVDGLDVIFFDSNPTATTFTDSQGIDINDADDERVIAVVRFASTDFAPSAGNNQYATKQMDLLIKGNEVDDLYAVLTSAGSWTLGSANGIGFIASIEKAA